MLKRAGFDFLVITGQASQWVILEIREGAAAVRIAETLKGKSVSDVTAQFPSESSTAVIGPAGENGVRFASIIIDGRYAAGRGGLGAVMGAKRLKAISVSGRREVAVAKPDELAAASADIMRLLRASPAVFGEAGLAEFGTAALVDLMHARRMEPALNFRATYFAGAGVYSGYAMKKRYAAIPTGCAGCPILCKKVGSDGTILPEYDSVSHFGALLGNDDLGSIVGANRLCNDLGMDTISAACTLACHAELQGTTFSPSDIETLLRQLAGRSGIGDALAEGSFRYAKDHGRPELSMTVKGLELPAYDPRGAYGMALAYATSTRGGCHMRAYPISHEVLRKPVATDRFSFEGKARIVRIAEDMNAVVDSLTACRFVFFAAGIEEYAHALSAVLGVSIDSRDLFRIGERVWNAEWAMNRANGFTVADDDLPQRFFLESGSSGGNLAVPPLDRREFLQARENYYRIRGYENGRSERM